jgi:hypothetical protein
MTAQPPSTDVPPSPRHYPRASLITSASGIADSTISFNTYATGITEGSLCLSQFPPPPMTIPTSASPTTERFLPSPTRSTFTIPAPAHTRAGPGMDQVHPSPTWSTFTINAPAQVIPVGGLTSPLPRPSFVMEQGLPSPAQSTFTITSPVSANTAPLPPPIDTLPMPSYRNRGPPNDSGGTGATEPPQNWDPRAGSQTPISQRMEGTLSAYDWHEGSSIISVDPTEERMLSTSFITELLSSTASIGSAGDAPPRRFRPPYQVDAGSLVSEMSYPPSSSRHPGPIAGSSHFPLPSHRSTFPGEGSGSRLDGEKDTIASYSYEGHADIVRPEPGLTRKVSVVGMAPATLRRVTSTSSITESLHPQSQVTCGSTAPLVFSSAMDKMRTTDIQPSIGASHPSERPGSLDFTFSKPLIRPQRRASAISSKTVRSHVSSLISSAGYRTSRAARATMEWMRIKPLPPLPTIPNISLYQEQEHRKMEGAVPLPDLVERADRLNAMLDSGHLPHDSVRSSPSLGFDKDLRFGARASGLRVTLGGRKRQSVSLHESQSESPHSPSKSKSLLKRPISRRGKINIFIGASILSLLVLVGVVVGIMVGDKRKHSTSCPVNRTGNTCSLGKLCLLLACNSIDLPTN